MHYKYKQIEFAILQDWIVPTLLLLRSIKVRSIQRICLRDNFGSFKNQAPEQQKSIATINGEIFLFFEWGRNLTDDVISIILLSHWYVCACSLPALNGCIYNVEVSVETNCVLLFITNVFSSLLTLFLSCMASCKLIILSSLKCSSWCLPQKKSVHIFFVKNARQLVVN